MSEDTEIVSDMVRKGAYFDASRAWYQALYIGPIAERTFFLIVAVLSFFVAVFAFISLTDLLPLSSRPGLVVKAERADEVILSTSPLSVRGQPLNDAMLKFMVNAYVIMRESYDAADYRRQFAFVSAHSDSPTAAAYAATFAQNNPQNPLRIYGDRGERKVTIDDLTINDKVEPKVATVRFTAETDGVANPTKTRWTAVMQYYYSDMIVQEVPDPETGESMLKTQDAQFQVVSYALSQNP